MERVVKHHVGTSLQSIDRTQCHIGGYHEASEAELRMNQQRQGNLPTRRRGKQRKEERQKEGCVSIRRITYT